MSIHCDWCHTIVMIHMTMFPSPHSLLLLWCYCVFYSWRYLLWHSGIAFCDGECIVIMLIWLLLLVFWSVLVWWLYWNIILTLMTIEGNCEGRVPWYVRLIITMMMTWWVWPDPILILWKCDMEVTWRELLIAYDIYCIDYYDGKGSYDTYGSDIDTSDRYYSLILPDAIITRPLYSTMYCWRVLRVWWRVYRGKIDIISIWENDIDIKWYVLWYDDRNDNIYVLKWLNIMTIFIVMGGGKWRRR